MPNNIRHIQSAFNNILLERDRLYPNRDPKNTSDMQKYAALFVNALRDELDRNWKPNTDIVRDVRSFLENPIFICGYMKSGTTLLTALLDDHPELIVMPGDSEMINLIDNSSSIYRKISDKDDRSPLNGQLHGWDTFWTFRFISPLGQAPYWIFGEGNKPYKEFLHYLYYWLRTLPDDHRRPFLSVVLAYYCANPRRNPYPKAWIEKTPGNELKVSRILSLFPSARFIHIVRNPLNNTNSLKRLFKVNGWKWNIDGVGFNIKKSFKVGLSNRKKLGENRYLIIRYEDLLRNTVDEMYKVIDLIGVSMSNKLLRPTVNGLPVKSNTMFKEREIQGKILNDEDSNGYPELNPLEQESILAILYFTVRKMGYIWDKGFLEYSRAFFRHLIFRSIRIVKR